MTTAVRNAEHQVRDGVRMLRPDADIPYRDGAEDRLFEIVSAATDTSSDSIEMLASAHGWAESYHTHPARANILRSLDIAPGTAVLEIGAGCGPITRYLGEIGAVVDALEPVLPRARVARERTRDLDGVQVFCGLLDDLPDEPSYDLVVVVGVLEYVANGAADREPYLSFLQGCRRRLRPGGSLALAIENKLGVKYLTGTGEDHSGRIFDSIEDYPRGSPARTFSSTGLLDLVAESGFSPRLLGVFPDYKHTRVVFDVEALRSSVAPNLVENLPAFPSRFAGTRSLRLASESRVWRELARAEVGAHFTNSLLVVGTAVDSAVSATPTQDPHGRSALWPGGRLARYFSIDRRPEYRAVTTVSTNGGAVTFDRDYSPTPGALIERGDTTWGYVAGDAFIEAFAAADEAGRRALLARWIALVEEQTPGDSVALDAIPTNLIVTGDGELRLIDSEFHDVGSAARVLDRGLFWLALHLSRTTPPEVWSPALTVHDLTLTLAGLAGLPRWDWESFCDPEAAFQVAVTSHYLGADPLAAAREGLTTLRDARIWDTPLGRRLHHDADDDHAGRERAEGFFRSAAAERDRLRREVQDLSSSQAKAALETAQLRRTNIRLTRKVEKSELQLGQLKQTVKQSQAKAAQAREALAAVRGSRTYRLADKLRRGLRRIRPTR